MVNVNGNNSSQRVVVPGVHVYEVDVLPSLQDLAIVSEVDSSRDMWEETLTQIFQCLDPSLDICPITLIWLPLVVVESNWSLGRRELRD